MIYDHATLTQQSNYNFLFTIAGDSNIYPCSANRCSLASFTAQPTVTMTVYKLPDGFQRLSNLADQTTLQTDLKLADHQYTLQNIPTQPTNAAGNRTYELAYLQPDGTATTVLSDTITANSIQTTGQPWWNSPVGYGVEGFGFIFMLALGWWLWKKRQ